MTRGSRERWPLAAALTLVVAASCNSEVKSRGQLMVAITTDMSVTKDMDEVRVEVIRADGTALPDRQIPILPAQPAPFGKPLPGTIAIVPSDAGGQALRVRLTARRLDKSTGTEVSRIVREAIVKVPTDRVALLRMPLHWLCEGMVMSAGGDSYRSACADDETCVAGGCKPADQDVDLLPDYSPAAVFGGGDPSGKGGYCLDVPHCFGQSDLLKPDDECSVPLPDGADPTALNVALVLKPESDGHCLSSADGAIDGVCYVPLDSDVQEGFAVDGNRIRLPQAACKRLSVTGIAVSQACRTKDLSVPVCGPWTGWPASDGGSSGGAAGTGTGADGGAVSAGGLSTGGTGNTGGTAISEAGSLNVAASGGLSSGGNSTAGNSTGGSAVGGASPFIIDVANSVTQRGGDLARTANWVQPKLTLANIPKVALDTAFSATFQGEMMASPVFIASTTPGKGRFFAVTTQNSVYALDETTGATLWQHNIGAPLTGSAGPGSTSHGILSTPVIDPSARVIYVAGALAAGRQEIHALSIDTGTEITGWPVNVGQVLAGPTTFNVAVQNQRSALSLVGGILYVAYGGNFGDAGNYHGWVVSVKTADPTQVAGWATLGIKEGIWAAGGMASDGNGVFAVTANGSPGPTTRDNTDSEEVIRITGMSVPNRDDTNLFYPGNWATLDASDREFGASSPSLVSLPSSAPSKLLVAPSKGGRVFFLDATKLGGLDGQIADLVVSSTTADSVLTTPTSYKTPSGTFIAISTGAGSLCPLGVSNANVMGISLKGAPLTPHIEWCATTSTNPEITRRSPVSTNSDASGADPVVWFLNGGSLAAFSGETGTTLLSTTGMCAGVHRYTSPIVANGRIIVGGDGHLCSWSVH